MVIAPQPGGFGRPPHLGELLARQREGVRFLEVDTNPGAGEIAAAVAQAASADVVVLGTYHWLGAFPGGLAELAEQLSVGAAPLVVVALGNPDDNRFLRTRPDAYLAVYGYREANLQGAAAVLTGLVAPTGKLPVPAGDQPLGAGLVGFGENE